MSRRSYLINEEISPMPGWTCILKVGCQGINDLNDQSSFSCAQVGGITGVSEYSDDTGKSLQLNASAGTKPRWVLNKAIFPMIIEYDLKRLGIRGHGWIFEFRNQADNAWLLGNGVSVGAQDKYSYGQGTGSYMERAPSTRLNTWVHVKVIYDESSCRLYFDDLLVNTFNRVLPTAVCHNFSIRYDNGDQGNNANAAFRNIRLYQK